MKERKMIKMLNNIIVSHTSTLSWYDRTGDDVGNITRKYSEPVQDAIRDVTLGMTRSKEHHQHISARSTRFSGITFVIHDSSFSSGSV